MTSPIRVRRHVDGRVAVCLRGEADAWIAMSHWAPTVGLADADVEGDHWTELLVAELPGADGENNQGVSYWDTSVDRLFSDGPPNYANFDELRADALKMLAAVAARERHRAEREANQQ